jgi:hypothetical protein
MSRAMSRAALAVALVCLTAVASLAQQSTTSTETKTFEVIAVVGNQLDVRLPEGTRELTVPDDFRFTVNGKQLSVHELIPGMKGTATITTRTTITPVTVTEVKSGQVVVKSGSSIIVRTPEGVRSFSQGEVDKRGVKIMKDGKQVQLSELHEGDRLSATVITAQPPTVVSEKEVIATLAAAKADVAAAPSAAAAPPPAAPTVPPASRTSAAPGPTVPPASTTPAPVAPTVPAASTTSAPPAPPVVATNTLTSTATSWPVLGLVALLVLAIGLVLTFRRRVH